jgi:site-specific recombinase XerD
MRKTQHLINDLLHEMAMWYNIDRITERRIYNAWQQFQEVTGIEYIQQVKPEHITIIYRHWRDLSNSAQNMRKRMQYIKRLLVFTLGRGIIRTNPAALFRMPHMPMPPLVSLSVEQVEQIKAAKVYNDTLDNVRAMFLLQCYTGVSYVDLPQVTAANITRVHGKAFLILKRKKTGAQCIVPLSEEVVKMVATFNYPYYTNAFFNKQLKLLQRLSGIPGRLTSHIGRKTFTQRMINEGWPMESVSRMLGHTTTVITERHYGEVGIMRMVADVLKAA